MSWRDQIKNGYPWMPLAFVGVMAILIAAMIYAMVFIVPAERAVIDHGTTTTGHAIAWKDAVRRRRSDTWKDFGARGRSYTWKASITWTDAQGHAHEQKELPISEGEASILGGGSDVEIRYIGDCAIIAADAQHRLRDESNVPVVLGICVICALLGLYHWRRRLREWRAPKPVEW